MSEKHWNALKNIDAVYECPKDELGKRLGPLVTYAGTYEPGKHYVGDIYANLAVLERNAGLLATFAADMTGQLPSDIDLYVGAPEGGKAFALLLAKCKFANYAYPEQEVVKTDGGRDEKVMVFKRHLEAIDGMRVAIVEDVMNNFSTTADLIGLIRKAGGEVVCIVGILNRSENVEDTFQGIPVHALIRKQIAQYRQDDSTVADDIASGNLAHKVKAEWPRLKAAMANAAVTHPDTAGLL